MARPGDCLQRWFVDCEYPDCGCLKLAEKSQMNMIEKVARAIDKAGQDDSERIGLKGVGLCFDNVESKENQRLMMALAKAAIEAMKEPTEEMLIAALHDYMSYEKQGPNKSTWNGKSMWNAMIEAALLKRL